MMPTNTHARAAATLACGLALAAGGCQAQTDPPANGARWGGCDSYRTQPQAQKAWQAADRPEGADGDSDGRVCETLPASPGRSGDTPTRRPPGAHQGDGEAKTTNCSRRPAVVTFSRLRYPNIVRHIEDSWAKGYPRTLTIHRAGASDRRDRLLANIPTRDGFDRDESPAAALRARVKADVRYVPSGENQAAGSSLGGQIGPYCDGTRVTYRFTR